MKRRWLAVGIILLFIGVAVAPSINISVVKASNDNDLVEVTSQACGIEGYGDTTVKITRQQYHDLGQYLVDFRARLNQTSTREEAVPIFKEAVVELDKYGLLPKGMNVKQAQNLVTIGTRKVSQLRPLEASILKQSNSLSNNNTVAFFCMIAGKSTNTYFQTLINTASMLLGGLFLLLPFSFILGLFIWTAIHGGGGILLEILASIAWALGLGLVYLVFPFLVTHSGISAAATIRYAASQGWIRITGPGGSNISVNGTFSGSFPIKQSGFFASMGPPGVIGFTGLHLRTNPTSHKSYYFGSALLIAVTS
jgi:hypothetical protein